MIRRSIVLSVALIGFGPSATAIPAAQDSAQLSGRIIEVGSNRPIRRARVHLANLLPGSQPVTVLSDQDGRYVFQSVPAGKYLISASKATYVSDSYSQTTRFNSQIQLDVKRGMSVTGLDIEMVRGGVIVGHIDDEDSGEPVPDVIVSLMRMHYVRGSRQLVEVGSRPTNDLGEFRLFGIPDGSYYLSASVRPQSQPRDNYARLYYPGVSNFDDAEQINVKSGDVNDRIEMPIRRARGATIRGTVIDSTGRFIQRGTVLLSSLPLTNAPAMSSTTDESGAFEFTNVLPSSYTLKATSPNGLERATLKLAVYDTDFQGLTVTAYPPTTISGYVSLSATATVAPSTLWLSAVASDPDQALLSGTVSPIHIDSKLSFSMKVWRGRILLRGGSTNSQLVMGSVHLNGVDITDRSIEVAGQSLSNLAIEFTEANGQVEGTVSDQFGQPIRAACVVVFPQDRTKWQSLAIGARTDSQGHYQIRTLQIGEYYVAAASIGAIAAESWENPDFLEHIRDSAVTFSINHENSTRIVALTLNR